MKLYCGQTGMLYKIKKSRSSRNREVAFRDAAFREQNYNPMDLMTTIMIASALKTRGGIPSGRLREEAEKRRLAENENHELKLLIETLQHIERQSVENIKTPPKKELVKWKAAYDALLELGIQC